ncbi:MAG: hypothetical protein JWO67_6345, partial [Streptosporangiaceae bacterium]|nr:hypothetical protein [Streptosporangiaceae bacterium]
MTTTTTRPTRSRRAGSEATGAERTAAKTRPAPARPPARPEPAGRPGPVPSSPARSVIRTTGSPAVGAQSAPPRAPFVLLVVGLLGGALVSLLLLNTVLAEDAFTLTKLQRSNKQLGQQRQALQEEIAREESPEVLAQKAKALGMVQVTRP